MDGNFFKDIKTIAIVGLSDKPERPSNIVARYFIENGFTVIPVNPNTTEVMGLKSYPDILSIPKEIKVDVVDIFRKSDEVLPHIKETIEKGDINTIWMQEGVVNYEAEKLARDNGINIIMDFCLMATHKTIGSAKS